MLGTRSDEDKVILGCPRKGPEVVQTYPYADDVIPAGTAFNLNSDGEAEPGVGGFAVGISRGVSMNHPERISGTIRGKGVPLRLLDLSDYASGTIEINAYADLLDDGDGFDSITIGETEFVAQAGAVNQGDPTFRAATSNEATATSLADQINTHADTKDLVTAVADGAIVTVTAKEKGEDGNSIALEYTDQDSDEAATLSDDTLLGGVDNDFSYVVEGDPVFLDDATGHAAADGEGATESNWKYASGVLEGVSPTPNEASASCALVNMAGI